MKKTMRFSELSMRVGLAALMLSLGACKSNKSTKSEEGSTPKTAEPAPVAPDKADTPATAATADTPPTPTAPEAVAAKPPPPEPTTKAKVDGAELDVWVQGEGTPILFIHGVMFLHPFQPLIDKLAAKGGFQIITYARRGYGGKKTGPIDIPGQAKDAIAVLDHLKVDKANVVGHSYGAAIAVQVALQSPDRLLSLALLEPPLLEHAPSGKAMAEGLGPIVEKYKSGDKEGALADFLAANGGNKEVVDRELPAGAYGLALTDIDTLFQVELPALGSWKVKPADVKKLKMPVLLMKGHDTLPVFAESGDAIMKWLPKTKKVEVAAANHMFPVTQPDTCAESVAQFVVPPKK